MPTAFAWAGERQLVIAVDHRLAPGNPAFVSAASKKSFLQRKLTDS